VVSETWTTCRVRLISFLSSTHLETVSNHQTLFRPESLLASNGQALEGRWLLE